MTIVATKQADPRAPITDTNVLVVDLDGTLTPVDTLHEALVKLIKEQPRAVLQMPQWLAAGKARFKSKVADHATVDATILPYNAAVLERIEQARSEGWTIILATASDRRIADAVADHLGLFDDVIATTGERNLSGGAKRDALIEHFGHGGFDYMGNDDVDHPIWEVARRPLLVDAPDTVVAKARRMRPDAEILSARSRGLKPLIKAARVYQWVKNLLIFVPLLASQQITAANLFQTFLAFFCFSAAASSIYLINDIFDLEADRRHPRKCRRPFASGRAPILHGLVGAIVLMVAALAGAVLVAPAFALVLLGYLFVTVNYSMWLKRYAIIDIVLLAGLYTVRILAGGAAIDVPLTLWLLGFSMFLFSSLAFAKRYAEVVELLHREEQTAAGRGYRIGDQNVMMSLGTTCGVASIVTLALYVNSAAASGLYGNPQFLWAECPLLLYWISRVWLAAQRERLTDDPIVFAFKDRASRYVFAIALVPILLALAL